MDKLSFAILFVTLSLISVGTAATGTTAAPTTAAPTTVAPTTVAPTTAAPGTTAAPTTAATGTTAAPTTAAPGTTAAPTTAATGTTGAPTTAATGTTGAPTTAATATTAAPGTTAAPTTVAPGTTAAPGTTVAPATTAAPGNGTTNAPHMTTGAGNMTNAPHMTTAAGNMTNAPHMTTAAGNMTTAPHMTTAAGNMTTAPHMTTAAGNNTAAPATTAAPPLTPNTTVETLETPVSRTQCGTQQLCAAEPSDCDPSTGSCFFLAAKQTSGQNFEFGLSGESAGYIAATLSADSTLGGNDTTYVCANNNGVVKFFSTVLNNGVLTVKEMNVNSVKGRVNGSQIQCTFAATVPSPATRASATSFSVAISTGSFNATSDTLGAPSTQLRSPVVNLADPNTTVTNEISPNTTPSPGTTANGIALQQSLMQALLITVGVLGLVML